MTAHDSMPIGSRKGWRVFSCPSCGWEGAIATRDRFSPSHEDCPACIEVGADVSLLDQIGSFADTHLETDKMGNLIYCDPWTKTMNRPAFSHLTALPNDYFSPGQSPWVRAYWKGNWYRFEREAVGAPWILKK